MNYQDTLGVKKRIKHREDMFLRRLFGMFAKMAKADGRVDAWETHAAERAFAKFPRAASRRKFCIRVFNDARSGRIPLAKMAWDFANKWAMPEDCLAAYEILWDIACSTGILKPIHKNYLECLCRFLKLPETYFGIYYRKRQGQFREWTEEDEQRIREERRRAEAAREAESRRKAEEWYREEARRQAERERREQARGGDYQKRMWDWFHRTFNGGAQPGPREKPRRSHPLQAEYDILGCSPDSTTDELRAAYRAVAKKCHPDLLRARGCEESAIAEATVMMAKINTAWEKIRKERGL